jgi:succinate dehydrogenase / fumarate reductase flavoprotein subunit
MVQGGLNAPLRNIEDDSRELHIQDTIRAGYGLSSRDVVKRVVYESISTIEWLEEIGVPFSRVDEASRPLNSIAQRRLGGASRKRACYAQDYTGLKIVHTLFDRALKSGVKIRDGLYLLELFEDEGEIFGGLFYQLSFLNFLKSNYYPF